MPPNAEPKKSPSRRKPRPSFEVPPEVETRPAAGWVYKEGPPAPPQTAPVTVPAEQPAPPKTETALDQLLTSGAEVLALGLATMTRLFVAAASLAGAPLAITRRLLR